MMGRVRIGWRMFRQQMGCQDSFGMKKGANAPWQIETGNSQEVAGDGLRFAHSSLDVRRVVYVLFVVAIQVAGSRSDGRR